MCRKYETCDKGPSRRPVPTKDGGTKAPPYDKNRQVCNLSVFRGRFTNRPCDNNVIWCRPWASFLLLCEILDPTAFFQHPGAEEALDQVCTQTQSVHRYDGERGKPAQAEGQRHADGPDKTAVKQEGDHGLAAGAQSEIGGVVIGIEGHHAGDHADQRRGDAPDGIGGVIDPGEQPGDRSGQHTEKQTADHRQSNELPVGVLDFLPGDAGAHHLTHNDSYHVAHGEVDNAGQIA